MKPFGSFSGCGEIKLDRTERHITRNTQDDHQRFPDLTSAYHTSHKKNMHRYKPYNASSAAGRASSRSPSGSRPRAAPAPRPGDGEEQPAAGEEERDDRVGGDKKRPSSVSEAVLEHRVALLQVDVGTSGTLAFAATLDHALRCKR